MQKITYVKLNPPISLKNFNINLPCQPNLNYSTHLVYMCDLVLVYKGLFRGYSIIKDVYNKRTDKRLSEIQLKKYMMKYSNIIIAYSPIYYRIKNHIHKIFRSQVGEFK